MLKLSENIQNINLILWLHWLVCGKITLGSNVPTMHACQVVNFKWTSKKLKKYKRMTTQPSGLQLSVSMLTTECNQETKDMYYEWFEWMNVFLSLFALYSRPGNCFYRGCHTYWWSIIHVRLISSRCLPFAFLITMEAIRVYLV